jgi:hypothetical protein
VIGAQPSRSRAVLSHCENVVRARMVDSTPCAQIVTEVEGNTASVHCSNTIRLAGYFDLHEVP